MKQVNENLETKKTWEAPKIKTEMSIYKTLGGANAPNLDGTKS